MMKQQIDSTPGGDRSCWVVKIGSALLTDTVVGLNGDAIRDWVEQIVNLRRSGLDVVLVSSGSIAEGMQRLGWKERPHALYQLQAAAAVGQMGLIQAYESAFQKHGLKTAQVLLTHDDLADRQRYLNARTTLRTLLELGVIPVVNENDTVVTDEICFGDNDTLAALVANLTDADQLIILTDQEGLHDKDPRHHPDAKLISTGVAGDQGLEGMAGPGSTLGRGGMLTKLKASAKAARSGTTTIIAPGGLDQVLEKLLSGEAIGTRLEPQHSRLAARKQWLAGHMRCSGSLTIDQGAVTVLREAGRSLLPVGVTAVDGKFSRGEVVACVDQNGKEVARGLVNYSDEEARKIIGFSSDQIEGRLGYVDEPELIHRDNLWVN
ncbi:MAG TPA: glutamate 5-kinase [Arenicellales bacterium]|jgi:glutamate 5-kinase|nr:glutamate 5-kinase [Arenicellales bacterium]HJL66829.1 glutamate 5-kinase [Arenicellales bacterium]|tara:strand:+ start:1711 stop:2844 length:1134 start_codon:yes stop_codon:yes gene_type:complete